MSVGKASLIFAPAFLEMVIDANRTYLKGFNISFEIALYFHKKGFNSQINLANVLLYNLDRDRLEMELRKFLLVRLLDNKFDAKSEAEFSERLRENFGGKFNHRLKMIIEGSQK